MYIGPKVDRQMNVDAAKARLGSLANAEYRLEPKNIVIRGDKSLCSNNE